MDKFKRIISLVVFVPIGIVLIVLAVANRQVVTLALNPFRPEDGMLAVSAPFFLFLFLALLIGLFLGSFVTWWSQGKHRKQARVEARSAARWQNEHKAAVAGRPASAQLPSK
jgi:uncharacterized integral membrane protein